MSACDALGTLPRLDSRMSRPVRLLLRTSLPRTSLLRRSRLVTWPFLISTERIELLRICLLPILPEATPQETPPSETNSATRATAMAGEGSVGRRRLKDTYSAYRQRACSP